MNAWIKRSLLCSIKLCTIYLWWTASIFGERKYLKHSHFLWGRILFNLPMFRSDYALKRNPVFNPTVYQQSFLVVWNNYEAHTPALWLAALACPWPWPRQGRARPLGGSEMTHQHQDRGKARRCFFSHPIRTLRITHTRIQMISKMRPAGRALAFHDRIKNTDKLRTSRSRLALGLTATMIRDILVGGSPGTHPSRDEHWSFRKRIERKTEKLIEFNSLCC